MSVARKYFGTDGVRGKVGQPPLTVDFVLRLASAAARALAPEGGIELEPYPAVRTWIDRIAALPGHALLPACA